MEWTIRKAREDAGKMQKRSEIFVEKKDSETANMKSHFKKTKASLARCFLLGREFTGVRAPSDQGEW